MHKITYEKFSECWLAQSASINPKHCRQFKQALCTIRSRGTKSHLLVSKLHSGTSKTKAGQGGLVRVALSCVFAPRDRVVQRGLFKLSALLGINWHALSQSAFWDILIYIFMPRTDVAISKKLKWSYEIENNSRRLKLTEVQKDEIKCRTWN